jgi:hypothetical protein
MDFACQYLTINYEKMNFSHRQQMKIWIYFFKKLKTNYGTFFLNKTTLDITNFRSI